jgi:hypothetical protein
MQKVNWEIVVQTPSWSEKVHGKLENWCFLLGVAIIFVTSPLSVVLGHIRLKELTSHFHHWLS